MKINKLLEAFLQPGKLRLTVQICPKEIRSIRRSILFLNIIFIIIINKFKGFHDSKA